MAITLDGTEGITAPNVFGRNLIFNGSGRINQRGYTSGTATSGANEYTLDRWRVVTSGQNLTFTGNDAGRVMTAPAGGCEQVIEGANIAGGTYVLNWTGTATATVDGNAVDKGDTFTLTANTNATVRMIGGTFSEVQVEAGSVATPFERRSFGTELALCQRYYQAFLMRHRFPASAGSQIGGSDITFNATMRAIPTSIFLSNNYTNNVAAVFVSNITVSGLIFELQSSSSGDTYRGDNYAFDAEL